MRYYLSQKGYTEYTQPLDLINHPKQNFSQHFIQFTVSGAIELDKQLLIAAFNAGCKVILDELDLDPRLEETLNHLLTGTTPNHKPPTHPGFFIFASQNGTILEGRKSLSKALLNRFNVMYAKEDTREELLEIAKIALSQYSLSKKEIEKIVDDFLRAKQADPTKSINSRTFFKALEQIKKDLLIPQMPIVDSPTHEERLVRTIPLIVPQDVKQAEPTTISFGDFQTVLDSYKTHSGFFQFLDYLLSCLGFFHKSAEIIELDTIKSNHLKSKTGISRNEIETALTKNQRRLMLFKDGHHKQDSGTDEVIIQLRDFFSTQMRV